MKYIQGTIGLPLILLIYKSINIKWYVDAAFGAHKDVRSHTSAFMTMVKVGAYVQFINTKMNTKISTKAELVVMENFLIQVIWT